MSNLNERLEQMTPLQKAVYALKESKARLASLEQRQAEPIAIVGISCRFPGDANGPEVFWDLLCAGRSGVREVPPERWDVDEFYDPDPSVPGKMNTRWGGFIDNVDLFDNHFFSISDREAAHIDPQHRMLLELGWEAFEDAGLAPSRLRGTRTGVFLGISHSEYGIVLSSDVRQSDAFVSTGTALCIAANRLSYAYDFVGPSLVTDTACSSSLVAVHLACQSIRSGESDCALAGGVSLILSPMATINLTKAGFSAPDGRVRAFDAAASGYVRGEGCGLLVLKRLSQAQADGDPIYAVIRGSAVNQSGACNGLTAPSSHAQEQVIREAHRRAHTRPGDVQYVETQGTGTQLGDVIEARALGAALREGRAEGTKCRIGSVKTNLGHLEAAAGVASVIKVALSLHNAQIPPSINYETPNPEIPFDQLPIRVQQELSEWPASETPQLAAVSAFGFGGSNAHLILEAAPASELDGDVVDPADAAGLMTISARTESARSALAAKYIEFLQTDKSTWNDVCAWTTLRRDHHDCRLVVVAAERTEALQKLQAYTAGQNVEGVYEGRRPFGREPKLGISFGDPGQVWTWWREQDSRSALKLSGWLEKVDPLVAKTTGRTLEQLSADASVTAESPEAVAAGVALQLALADWLHAGCQSPAIVMGTGAGELSAAVLAGILPRDSALQMAMSLTGDATAADAASIQPSPAKLPFVSARCGLVRDVSRLDLAHWQESYRNPGDPSSLDSFAAQRQLDALVEFSADGPAARSATAGAEAGTVRVLPALTGAGLGDCLRQLISALYAIGVNVRWSELVSSARSRVRLPRYAWQKQSLWALPNDWLRGREVSAIEQSQAASRAEGAAETAASGVETRPDEQTSEPRPPLVRPELNIPYVAPRTPLENHIASAWIDVLNIDRVGVHDNFFELGGDSLQGMTLVNRFQEELGEVVSVLALFQSQTVEDLAAYFRRHYRAQVSRMFPDEELPELDASSEFYADAVNETTVDLTRRFMDSLVPRMEPPAEPEPSNDPALFILSPPRCGTTLLRVMLAGHPRMFAPPELELLQYQSMQQRAGAHEHVDGGWLQGGVRATMEVLGASYEEADEFIARCVRDGWSVQRFYRFLQEGIGDRILVDKTPTYAIQLQTLEHAEQIFRDPLYVHLVRHPCAMIRSFVDYKMHLTYEVRFGMKMNFPVTPEQIGELVWVVSHQNILKFLERIPPERTHRLYFEDLVREPEREMRSLCRFAGLEFAPDMINPYGDQVGRMTDSASPRHRMQGDEKFKLKHKSINPAVADAWKKHLTTDILGPVSRQVGRLLEYDIPEPQPLEAEEGSTGERLAAAHPRQQEAEQLLSQLDNLSDEEVAALLRQQLAEGPSDS